MNKLVTLMVGMLVAVAVVVGAQAAEEITIKKVMATCMKPGTLKDKIVNGEGNEADAKELLKMYQALAAATPPKGDEGSWKEKTGALVAAAEAVVAGKPDAAAELKSAANCAGCHKAHK